MKNSECGRCPHLHRCNATNDNDCIDVIIGRKHYMSDKEKEIRAKVLDKVEELYKDKSSKIYSQWVGDSLNVPKPSFISSVALVNAICESLKTDSNK